MDCLEQSDAERERDQYCNRAGYHTREQNRRNTILDGLRFSFSEGEANRYEVTTDLTVDSEQSRKRISCRDSSGSEHASHKNSYDLGNYSTRSEDR